MNYLSKIAFLAGKPTRPLNCENEFRIIHYGRDNSWDEKSFEGIPGIKRFQYSLRNSNAGPWGYINQNMIEVYAQPWVNLSPEVGFVIYHLPTNCLIFCKNTTESEVEASLCKVKETIEEAIQKNKDVTHELFK